MTGKKATPETIADLEDIHRGLHVAMEAAFRENNASKLKITLHQVDDRMTALVNTRNGANPSRW